MREHDSFTIGRVGSVTVVEGNNGEWYTRRHTGRASARGTLYHFVKTHDSYETALAYARSLADPKAAQENEGR